MSGASRDPLSEAYAEAAARWLVANRAGAQAARERGEFLAWLRESPKHVEAYLRAAGDAEALSAAAREWPEPVGKLVDAARTATDDPIPFPAATATTHARPGGRRRALVFAAAAALTGIAVVAGWQIARPPKAAAQTYRTAHGEQGSWPLPDGSTLHLNSESAAIVRFGREERLVELVSGQAMFQVAHDARRRFRVDTGSAQVIAVGTAFDVYRQAASARLVVLEGLVAVVARADASRRTLPADAIRVHAGQQLDLQRVGAAPEAADPRRASAWLQREVVFEATPLAEVVRELNRYAPTPIEIDSGRLRHLPITGVFGAYDVESFLAFLAQLDGVAIDRGPDRIRVFEREQTSAGRGGAPPR